MIHEATQVVASNIPTLPEALTLIAVVGQGILAHFKGRRGKKADDTVVARVSTGVTSAVRKIVDDHEVLDVERFTDISKKVDQALHHLVGVDGENGMRGELRSLKAQIDGIIDRERERLEADAGYDRRKKVGRTAQ